MKGEREGVNFIPKFQPVHVIVVMLPYGGRMYLYVCSIMLLRSRKRAREDEDDHDDEDVPHIRIVLHSPKRRAKRRNRKAKSALPSPPSTSASESSQHVGGLVSEHTQEGALDSDAAVTPQSAPPTPVFDTYDATFAAKIHEALQRNLQRSQEKEGLQQTWREQRYGTTIARGYLCGHTPEHIRDEYDARQAAAIETFEQELAAGSEEES